MRGALGKRLHQIEGGRVGPMQVLEDDRGRLRARPGEHPRGQRRHLPATQLLGRELRCAFLRQRDVDQRRDQGRIFGGVQADESKRVLEVGEALFPRPGPLRIAGVPIPRSGAAACSAGAAMTTIRQKCAASRRVSSETPRRGATCRCRARRPRARLGPRLSPLAPPPPPPAEEIELLLAPDERGEGARAAAPFPPLPRTIRKQRRRLAHVFQERWAPRSSATNKPDTQCRTRAVTIAMPGSAKACSARRRWAHRQRVSPASSTTHRPALDSDAGVEAPTGQYRRSCD